MDEFERAYDFSGDLLFDHVADDALDGLPHHGCRRSHAAQVRAPRGCDRSLSLDDIAGVAVDEWAGDTIPQWREVAGMATLARNGVLHFLPQDRDLYQSVLLDVGSVPNANNLFRYVGMLRRDAQFIVDRGQPFNAKLARLSH